jgi:hypothetical protein
LLVFLLQAIAERDALAAKLAALQSELDDHKKTGGEASDRLAKALADLEALNVRGPTLL